MTRRSGRDRSTRNRWVLGSTAAAVIAVDQLTKWWAVVALDSGRTIDVVWTLRFNLVRNPGTAFSLLSGMGSWLGLLALVVVAALVWMARLVSSGPTAVGVGLVLGGALGNLVDRVVRPGDGALGGYVVDFIDLQWWPVFNVADMGIVVGAALLVLFAAHRDHRDGRGGAGHGGSEAPDAARPHPPEPQ